MECLIVIEFIVARRRTKQDLTNWSINLISIQKDKNDMASKLGLEMKIESEGAKPEYQ